MKTPILRLLALAATAPAFAQAFNVDINNVYASPTATYGAAANQPGTWSLIPATATTTSVVTTTGAASSVTIGHTNGSAYAFSYDNPGTFGDDQALLDDGCDPALGIGPTMTWTISGLSAGNYRIYTYAWAPDSSSYVTSVNVPGSPDPQQNVGGNWSGGHVQGITYALHHISVSTGTPVSVVVAAVVSFATVDGFQIVPDITGTAFCSPGTAGVIPCACGNPNGAGAGCANTGSSGGVLTAAGTASLALDATDPGTVTLKGTNMLSGSTCIFLQGPSPIAAGLTFGAGIRCVGGQIMRLYVKQGIVGGTKTVPEATDRSISNRTTDLFPGMPITANSTWYYQAYYRDPSLANPGGSCPANATFNITSGVSILWAP